MINENANSVYKFYSVKSVFVQWNYYPYIRLISNDSNMNDHFVIFRFDYF